MGFSRGYYWGKIKVNYGGPIYIMCRENLSRYSDLASRYIAT